MNQNVFVLDARDNIRLEMLRDYYKLDASQINKVINSDFKKLVTILGSKKIKYNELKNALIPNLDKNEIVLVFDTNKIKSG